MHGKSALRLIDANLESLAALIGSEAVELA